MFEVLRMMSLYFINKKVQKHEAKNNKKNRDQIKNMSTQLSILFLSFWMGSQDDVTRLHNAASLDCTFFLPKIKQKELVK
jgi:hypothetical protein